MPADRVALLDLVDDLLDENRYGFAFGPGDIQFCNNYTVLHGRAPHASAATEDRSRLLMRIWIDMEDFRPLADEGIVRYGVVRHGRLGWSAGQVAAGLDSLCHARREDGAPRP